MKTLSISVILILVLSAFTVLAHAEDTNCEVDIEKHIAEFKDYLNNNKEDKNVKYAHKMMGKDAKVEVNIDNASVEYEIEYETPAPYSTEEEIKAGKRIKVFGPDDVHYRDVLAFTDLNENLNIKNPSKIKLAPQIHGC